MKIAYLITAYGNYIHLEKLIRSLYDNKSFFYIHIDQKSTMPDNLMMHENVIFIDRLKVWWGGWSHQQAILNLMKEARKNKFDYYVLISGTDYPIRKVDFLYNKLKTGGQFVNIIKGFQPHKPESRIKNYYLDSFDRKTTKSLRYLFYSGLEKIIQIFFKKKKYPFSQVYHGSTWWAINHSCLSNILDFTNENPGFVRFFKTSWCPEEVFIPTIIGNSKFLNECKNNLTYSDWTTDPAPAYITKEHVSLFKDAVMIDGSYGKYEPFFARKFSDKSSDVIKNIEKELRYE